MINYQGKLTIEQGGCLNDTVSMTFTIYSDDQGTVVDWTEDQDSVIVKEGVFNVLLGSVDSIPPSVFDGSTKYLGVQVESDPEMRPLKPVVSVAYAYRVGNSHWSVIDSVLYTNNYWGIARGGANNVLYGDSAYTMVNFGVGCTTGTSGQNWGVCTVSGGERNTAGGFWSTVGGGLANRASSDLATVGGGKGNAASHVGATIDGGQDNTASGPYSSVGEGVANVTSGDFSTVGGDYSFATGYNVRVTATADFTLAFGYNFTTSTPHAVVFFDDFTDMKVGIQTTNPTNILTVQENSATDLIADAWTIHSSKEYKRDIHELTPEEYGEALKKIVSVPVVKFYYKGENTKEKIGIISEEAPEQILAEGDNKP